MIGLNLSGIFPFFYILLPPILTRCALALFRAMQAGDNCCLKLFGITVQVNRADIPRETRNSQLLLYTIPATTQRNSHNSHLKDGKMSLLLTRKEVAHELSISEATVDRLITKGCLKVVRIGTRTVRIPYTEVVKIAKKDQPTLELN